MYAAGIGSILTLMLQAVYSLIASNFSAAEASRDADLEAIKFTILEARDLGVKYWLHAGDDPSSETEEAALNARLMFLGMVAAELLAKDEARLLALSERINDYDECLTGGAFGVRDRRPAPEKVPIIELTSYRLIHAATRERRAMRFLGL